MDTQDFKLPALYPFLKIYKAPDDKITGEPVWTLHNPLANSYFRLQWLEFECLSRFSTCETASTLISKIEEDTTLRVELQDIQNLVAFLNINGLISLQRHTALSSFNREQGFWAKILHGYLYFTIPLFRPQAFLEKYLPYVTPILSPKAVPVMGIVMLLALFMTMQRTDEFFHTFTGLFSVEGVIQIAITFGIVKIIHEMGHAFTAVRNGVPVPHMGIALIVLYPVLYTETTGAWQISSRKSRFEIGFAGVRAEFFLATIALFLWNIFPAGSTAQSLCFMVVAVSFVSSLLVNLNPLMRFDGYYMLSDMMGIENLQSRSCEFARWKIRRFLFGVKDFPPEDCDPKTEKFLTMFGLSLLIYRFFLFSGIAIAVYHIFFKPLGFFLMMVELYLFIIRPVLGELKIWWQRRTEFSQIKRARIAGLISMCLMLFLILPIHRDISLPAVAHASEYISIYPSAPSVITEIYAHEGDHVRKGDVILVLKSPVLEKEFDLARQSLQQLEIQQRSVQANSVLTQTQFSATDEDIEAAEKKLSALQDQKDRLVVTAPFDGLIRDSLDGLDVQRNVQISDILFRIVDASSTSYTAYIHESDLSRVRVNNQAVFIPDSAPLTSVPLTVDTVSVASIDTIDLPELSSCFGGAIQTECGDANQNKLTPVQSLYRVEFTASDKKTIENQYIMRGDIRIKGDYYSPFFKFIKLFISGILRESGVS